MYPKISREASYQGAPWQLFFAHCLVQLAASNAAATDRQMDQDTGDDLPLGDSDALLIHELSHRGKTRAVLVSPERAWTAGEKSLREWDMQGGENIKTWPACPDKDALVTCITLIAGRLWCGLTDGSISVFNENNGHLAFSLEVHAEPIGMVSTAFGAVWTSSTSDNVAVLIPDGANTKVQRRFALPPPLRNKSRVLVNNPREHGRTAYGSSCVSMCYRTGGIVREQGSLALL